MPMALDAVKARIKAFWNQPDMGYHGDVDRNRVSPMLSAHRDSDTSERSNFDVISADMLERFPEAAHIERFGHWAVGWVDYLMVEWLNESGAITPAGAAAMEWADKLDGYPVADEEAYSEAESDDLRETLQHCYNVDPSELDAVMRELSDAHSVCRSDDLRDDMVFDAIEQSGVRDNDTLTGISTEYPTWSKTRCEWYMHRFYERGGIPHVSFDDGGRTGKGDGELIDSVADEAEAHHFSPNTAEIPW